MGTLLFLDLIHKGPLQCVVERSVLWLVTVYEKQQLKYISHWNMGKGKEQHRNTLRKREWSQILKNILYTLRRQ